MTRVEDLGEVWNLPYRGRYGCQIRSTLRNIVNSDSDIALYAAMGLRGRAKQYGGRYKDAFVRFARANADKLEEGPVGPKGGYGFRYKTSR